MIRFDYLEPTTLKKAFALLEKHGDDARVIAGGTSLLIMMRQRLLTPKVVISLARIPKFDTISLQRQRRPAHRRRRAPSRHRAVADRQAALSPAARDLSQSRPAENPQHGHHRRQSRRRRSVDRSGREPDRPRCRGHADQQQRPANSDAGRIFRRLLSDGLESRRAADRNSRAAANAARLVAYQIHAAQRRRFRHRRRRA